MIIYFAVGYIALDQSRDVPFTTTRQSSAIHQPQCQRILDNDIESARILSGHCQ